MNRVTSSETTPHEQVHPTLPDAPNTTPDPAPDSTFPQVNAGSDAPNIHRQGQEGHVTRKSSHMRACARTRGPQVAQVLEHPTLPTLPSTTGGPR